MSDTTAQRISITRQVAAPASRIFAVLSHPNGHIAIDGSGMLMAAPDARPLRAVGDTFLMNMDREPLGDLPMGKYQVQNKVTRFKQLEMQQRELGMLLRLLIQLGPSLVLLQQLLRHNNLFLIVVLLALGNYPGPIFVFS